MKKIIFFTISIILIIIFAVTKVVLDRDTNKENTSSTKNYESSQINYNNLENATIVNGEKVNTSKALAKDHYAVYDEDESISKLLISNASITSISTRGISCFMATLKNTGNVDISSSVVTVNFINKKGKYVYSVDSAIKDDLSPGESVDIKIYDIEDFINSYDYEFRILLSPQ